jgi:hypothetical protein
MASANGVIFPESMADILANPVDICFGSMPATSTTAAACLVIEGNAVTADQQIGTDLLKETHPPTHCDLLAGIDHVEGMLSDIIKIYECIKCPRVTLPELFNDNKSLPLPLQVQVNNSLTPDKSMTTPGNKHLQHLRLLSSDAMMIHLVPTSYMQETSLCSLNAMALKSTTRRKPIWEPLLPL